MPVGSGKNRASDQEEMPSLHNSSNMGIRCVCAVFNYSVCIFKTKEWKEIVGFLRSQ